MSGTSGTSTVTTEVVMPGPIEPAGLQVQARDLPAPAAGQVLLRMEATGVSFAEQQMRRGRYYDQPTFPFVPGYDVVGTAVAVGPRVAAETVGRRFAAITKIGGWASHLLIEAADLMPVPEGLDPAEVETLIINGITAWQMLHRTAKVRPGGTIVVLGANGGVGSVLVQIARAANMTVIGTAAARHHDAVRALGATPVDYRDADAYEQIRALAPEGVDAVFDHIAGENLVKSWKLLRKGGYLCVYGNAATVNDEGGNFWPTMALVSRLMLWNYLPNRRGASFFSIWAGKTITPKAFRARRREDLAQLLQLLADQEVKPQIAARFPLSAATDAMLLAESRTVMGKVVLTPDA
ncbi:medium chain dehydrogenase/reductase family protein [Kineosporia rhizophila]|uniref:medium chain dehydrogenase/reductase family protein n=1 Tax=Kineosporia rhizophila TaxID=84633 RepID=UPI001E5E49EB|nr:medium chain dehydrogenase/reductase family protein [Kineosporia rhizophila]MCE0536444.1 medium chain dehydrogenase/reductase family protein [Kineosporia rhizophila]